MSEQKNINQPQQEQDLSVQKQRRGDEDGGEGEDLQGTKAICGLHAKGTGRRAARCCGSAAEEIAGEIGDMPACVCGISMDPALGAAVHHGIERDG